MAIRGKQPLVAFPLKIEVIDADVNVELSKRQLRVLITSKSMHDEQENEQESVTHQTAKFHKKHCGVSHKEYARLIYLQFSITRAVHSESMNTYRSNCESMVTSELSMSSDVSPWPWP